jgi:hypothetical protein
MRLTGRLAHSEIEGGAWLLIAEDGRRYQLLDAPDGYATGDSVEVEGDLDGNAMSFQMAGPLLNLRSIRRVRGR